DEPVGVEGGRRHVEVETGLVAVGGLPGGAPQRVAARGVAHDHRPRLDAAAGHVAMGLQRGVEVGHGLVGGLAVDLRLGREVPHPPCRWRPGLPIWPRRSTGAWTTPTVPASRKAVVPDFSISAAASWADSRSSSSVYTE